MCCCGAGCAGDYQVCAGLGRGVAGSRDPESKTGEREITETETVLDHPGKRDGNRDHSVALTGVLGG